ncbi:hypothetical protein Tco_1100928 [Tanacetum coccineum]
MFALEIKGMDGEECLEEGDSEMIEYELSETPHISLNALSGVPTHNTMRVKGHVMNFRSPMVIHFGNYPMELQGSSNAISLRGKSILLHLTLKAGAVRVRQPDLTGVLNPTLEEICRCLTMHKELHQIQSFDH